MEDKTMLGKTIMRSPGPLNGGHPDISACRSAVMVKKDQDSDSASSNDE